MRRRQVLLIMLVAWGWTGFSGPIAAQEVAPQPTFNPWLRLPPVIHSVVGIEANVYFDNVCLVLNPDNFAFDADCPIGRQLTERWTAVPTDKQVGDHPLKVTIRDQSNTVVGRAETIVRVVAADAAASKPISLLCIGDSLTHASVYPKSILDLCHGPTNPQLSLVGSHTPGNNPPTIKHEGYGGWTAERFMTHFTGTARTGDHAQRGSPFLYAVPNEKSRVDFKQYCQDVNGGKTPDYVTIFLGPNDIFSYQEETLNAGLEKVLKYYDQLVVMIRTASPSTRIGVMLPVPPAASQDAFGANYAAGQTRWQYKRNQHQLMVKLTEKYGGRVEENIDLIATHVNLDCRNNYPAAEVSANSRTNDKIQRQNNGVHPANTGYQQIGDSVYCWLKATAGK